MSDERPGVPAWERLAREELKGDPAVMQERLQQLDRQWTSAAENDPLLIKVLGHTASRNLRELQQDSAGFIDIFVTNQAGELVGYMALVAGVFEAASQFTMPDSARLPFLTD